tara:strand:+ start:39 stop:404 length:366 start_codon:yes stop_codon:yes gene_type:complete
MTDDQIALGRRAVACRGWRWMGGMATDEGHRVVLVDTDVVWMVYEGEGKCKPGCVEDFVPDLTDPATLGCLLALVREALNSPRVHVLYVEGLYRWECADNRTVHGVGATEAEALIETLEYA